MSNSFASGDTITADGIYIRGHRDFPGVAKACPSFDAKREYAGLLA